MLSPVIPALDSRDIEISAVAHYMLLVGVGGKGCSTLRLASHGGIMPFPLHANPPLKPS